MKFEVCFLIHRKYLIKHERLVSKLKENEMSGYLLNILEDFLRNTKQRVVLNG